MINNTFRVDLNNQVYVKSSQLNTPNHSRISFTAVTQKLEKILQGSISDGAELFGDIKRGIIPNTEDNIQALAKEWHKRKKPSEKQSIEDPMLEFWKINVAEVKIK